MINLKVQGVNLHTVEGRMKATPKKVKFDNMSLFHKIIIFSEDLNKHLKWYIHECSTNSPNVLIKVHAPVFNILRNISQRYSPQDVITDNDVELIVNLIQLNLIERDNRDVVYLHDILINHIISDFKLEEFVKRKPVFFDKKTKEWTEHRGTI